MSEKDMTTKVEVGVMPLEKGAVSHRMQGHLGAGKGREHFFPGARDVVYRRNGMIKLSPVNTLVLLLKTHFALRPSER